MDHDFVFLEFLLNSTFDPIFKYVSEHDRISRIEENLQYLNDRIKHFDFSITSLSSLSNVLPKDEMTKLLSDLSDKTKDLERYFSIYCNRKGYEMKDSYLLPIEARFNQHEIEEEQDWILLEPEKSEESDNDFEGLIFLE